MGNSFKKEIFRYTLWINRNKISSQVNENNIIQEELFDYSSDPMETENHIGKTGYKAIHNKLKQQALTFLSSTSIK